MAKIKEGDLVEIVSDERVERFGQNPVLSERYRERLGTTGEVVFVWQDGLISVNFPEQRRTVAYWPKDLKVVESK